MAKSTPVSHSAEILVDLFLSGEIDEDDKPTFIAEGDFEEERDGEVDTEPVKIDQHFLKIKIGKDLSHAGLEFNKEYEKVTHRSFPDDVKDFFNNQIRKADGDPDMFWPKYCDMMDKAVKDTGLDDATKVMGAVLLSTKGLRYLGSAVRDLVLRYIRERDLDALLKKLEQNTMNKDHPDLD